MCFKGCITYLNIQKCQHWDSAGFMKVNVFYMSKQHTLTSISITSKFANATSSRSLLLFWDITFNASKAAVRPQFFGLGILILIKSRNIYLWNNMRLKKFLFSEKLIKTKWVYSSNYNYCFYIYHSLTDICSCVKHNLT